MFDPADHYWLADDGRVYSSRRGEIVPADDPDYLAWRGAEPVTGEDGGEGPDTRRVPSTWPQEGGEQTQAALDAVLAFYRPAPVITTKADLFRRASDAEAEMIDTALKTGSLRERLIFEAAQYLDHADPLFASMRTALAGMFSEARADQLLAPSAA